MQVSPSKEGSIVDELVSIEKMIPNPLIVADEEGKIVYANQLALDFFGYLHQNFIGKKLATIIRFDFPALSEKSATAKCLGRRQNREQVELQICYRAISDNFINHWCISLFELTAPQVEKSHPSDQNSITEELKNELDNRLKELEVFSYAVAHDLQAPLRGIDGYTNLFIQKYAGQVDDQGRRLLSKVSDNVAKMQAQLQELDYLLKLGTIELHFSEIDMHALATETVKSLQLSQVIQVTIDENTRVMGDIMLMKEVLFRLISNAVKFSPEQTTSKIEIGCLRHGMDDHFFVRDFGVGFDEVYKDVVFGVFQQLHDPQQYPGIGLGLATVKQIITRHGGQVWAMGKENEGATFYFSLHSTTRSHGHS